MSHLYHFWNFFSAFVIEDERLIPQLEEFSSLGCQPQTARAQGCPSKRCPGQF
jgi:hypothetical protein